MNNIVMNTLAVYPNQGIQIKRYNSVPLTS
jgi:hypothetical protein